MKRIGWFTTARGPGSHGLFTAILDLLDSGEIDAQISFIFINRDVKGNQYRAQVIKMAEDRGIPVVILPSDAFMPELKGKDISAWRDAYGEEMRRRIAPYKMDFGVLAGYMLIIDPETCRRYSLINLHPALPDTYKGTWEEIVRVVVENKDDRYGSTVHVCSPELDCGDAITYDSFDVTELREGTHSEEELVQRIRAKEVRREAPLLMETIRLIVNGDILLKSGCVYDRQGRKVGGPANLADDITGKLQKS